jgi:hypothetical protein
MLKPTLIINRNDSICGNCGKGANWSETHHNSQLGWGNHPKNGCDIKWKYLSTDYVDEEFIEHVKRMRPDLEFIHPTDNDNSSAQIPKDN